MSEAPIRALVFANGDLNDGPAVQAALRVALESIIIAADGGARLALASGLMPHVVIGDMDSLTPEELDSLQAQGAAIQRYSAHKNETDLELALLEAVRRNATWIRLLGGFGGRIDQMLANVCLLMLPELVGRDVALVNERQTLWLIGPGTHMLYGSPGDTISLIPWAGDAVGVRTETLAYPLRDETLFVGPARGVSNVMLAHEARVTLVEGLLLVVHTPGRA